MNDLFLTKEDELSIIKDAKSGNEAALTSLFFYNNWLIEKISKKYSNFYSLDLNELKQTGKIGLVNALNNFDETKNVRFSTYALPYIENLIIKDVHKKNNLIDIPNNFLFIIKKVTSINDAYYIKKHKYPLIDEIYELLDKKISKENISLALFFNNNIVNIDSNLEFNIENDIYEIFEKKEENSYQNLSIINLLNNSFNTLTDKEMLILKLRYGLIDGNKHTLQEIANNYEISRERVRQIESRALGKIEKEITSKKYDIK